MVGSAVVWKRAISWKPDYYWRNCSERTGNRQPWRYSTWLVPNIGFGWIGATMALASVVKNRTIRGWVYWTARVSGDSRIGCGSNHGGERLKGIVPFGMGPPVTSRQSTAKPIEERGAAPVVSENTRLADNAPPLRMRLNPFTARTARLSVPTPVGFPSAGLRNVAERARQKQFDPAPIVLNATVWSGRFTSILAVRLPATNVSSGVETGPTDRV